ncbi:MAG: RNA methyltransferase [Zetaproteobacteria bacterium]|nr:RNA methyltransferase [Flavobacteriales bacterium]
MKYRKLKNSELNRLSVTDFKNSDKTPLLVVLDNIRSLNNIGSVFRTCDAFAIEKVYLCGITAQPPHNDINKTALGATESVAWEYATDVLTVINRLKADGVKIIAIEQAENSVALQDFELAKNQKYAVIFGNEVKGIQQSLVNAADCCVEIPQVGTKHSLNISVSCGVVLWDLFKKMRL